MPFWMATATYCNWPASKQPSWPVPSATTLSSAFYPQAPHRSGRQVTSLRSPMLTSASLELQTQSSCLLLLSQSLLLSCLLSDGPFTLRVGNHKGNAVSSIPFTVQHTKDWLIHAWCWSCRYFFQPLVPTGLVPTEIHVTLWGLYFPEYLYVPCSTDNEKKPLW